MVIFFSGEMDSKGIFAFVALEGVSVPTLYYRIRTEISALTRPSQQVPGSRTPERIAGEKTAKVETRKSLGSHLQPAEPILHRYPP